MRTFVDVAVVDGMDPVWCLIYITQSFLVCHNLLFHHYMLSITV